MKITKYEHSCLDIEIDGKRLLIDPGKFSNSIPNYDAIITVLVTHVHVDHLDIEKLNAIYTQNSGVQLLTVQAVSDELEDFIPHTVLTGSEDIDTGPFQLGFSGGQHALIHESVPITDNVGITVNNKFYYPGDSLVLPKKPIELLAVPITAPWLKISEAMDFIATIKPKRVLPVHDALLSELGMKVNGNWLKMACDKVGAEYVALKTGDFIVTNS